MEVSVDGEDAAEESVESGEAADWRGLKRNLRVVQILFLCKTNLLRVSRSLRNVQIWLWRDPWEDAANESVEFGVAAVEVSISWELNDLPFMPGSV